MYAPLPLAVRVHDRAVTRTDPKPTNLEITRSAMSSRHSHVDPSARRARFTEPQPSRPVPWTAIIIGASITFLAIAILAAGRLPASAGVTATAVTASADLDVPAATFDDGLAHFYRYVTAAGREVRFFVMKSRDGKVDLSDFGVLESNFGSGTD